VTDGQTDSRRTDRRTEFSSQYRVCITCSAVKTILVNEIEIKAEIIFRTKVSMHLGADSPVIISCNAYTVIK